MHFFSACIAMLYHIMSNSVLMRGSAVIFQTIFPTVQKCFLARHLGSKSCSFITFSTFSLEIVFLGGEVQSLKMYSSWVGVLCKANFCFECEGFSSFKINFGTKQVIFLEQKFVEIFNIIIVELSNVIFVEFIDVIFVEFSDVIFVCLKDCYLAQPSLMKR